MNSEARRDELRMSWNKKVSMREIAQFYEDKLRELNVKQTVLMEEISKKAINIEMKIKVLENSLENAKNFVEEYNEMKKYIEEAKDAITLPYQSLTAHLRGLDKLYEKLQIQVIEISEMFHTIALNQIAEHVAFEVYETFMISLFASDEALSNRMRFAIDHADTILLIESMKPVIEEYLKRYMGNITLDDSEMKNFAQHAVTALIHKVSEQLEFASNARKSINAITSKEVQQ